MLKTIAEINEKIRMGQAVVVTGEEIIGIADEKGFVMPIRITIWGLISPRRYCVTPL